MTPVRAVVIGVAVFAMTFLVTFFAISLDALHSAWAAAGLALASFALALPREPPKLTTVAVTLTALGVLVSGSGVLTGTHVLGQPGGPSPTESTDGSVTSSAPPSPVPPSVRATTPPTAPGSPAASPEPSSPMSSNPATTGAADLNWTIDLSPKRNPAGSPDLAASVSEGPSGSQRLRINLGNLGFSTIEWDLLDPRGGTVLGSSMAAPDTLVLTYDLYPTATGTYSVRVVNKDTGESASSSVQLTRNPTDRIVASGDYSGGPTIHVETEDSACSSSGTRVAVRVSNASEDMVLVGRLRDGNHFESTLSPDSTGTDYGTFGLKSSACSGGPITAGTLELRHGGTVAAKAALAVDN
jgi:hypothetical protein